ncbi:MAG: hypothetical protein K8S16_10185 [Bacteroidales bacterium]|nr:hypothetical protein [Bacteroidales bacterium]
MNNLPLNKVELAGTGSANDINRIVVIMAIILGVIFLVNRFARYLKNLPYYYEGQETELKHTIHAGHQG